MQNTMDKIAGLLNKHKNLLYIFGLLLLCYVLFFVNMGAYPLIDVDESRYIQISKEMLRLNDWVSLHLNGDFFLEKPPLYFWLEAASFTIFKSFSETAARLPIALTATFGVLFMYFTGKKVVSKGFGLASALILATSFQFLILSRIAMLDLLFSVCLVVSMYFGFMTFFVPDKTKKYCWWFFYIFAAFSVLSKGLVGIILPFGTVFLASLLIGKIKEFFKPVNFVVGGILFLLVALPWHIAMFKVHNMSFINEYFMKHHFSRFVDSEGLGRKQPFLFFVPVFFAGFLPWSASFIACISKGLRNFYNGVKQYIADKKFPNIAAVFNEKNQIEQFILLNCFAFVVIFAFFSVSSTKLATYILPAFFPAAFLLGSYWLHYIKTGENKKGIYWSVMTLNIILVILGIAGIIAMFFLPEDLKTGIKSLQPYVVFDLIVFPAFGICLLELKLRKWVFASYIAFMIALTMLITSLGFGYILNFGQNDLINYGLIAKKDNAKLATFGYGKRYSALYYYDGKVDFQIEPDYKWLRDELSQKERVYIIVKNKNIDDIPKDVKYVVVQTGKKYTLISSSENELKKTNK